MGGDVFLKPAALVEGDGGLEDIGRLEGHARKAELTGAAQGMIEQVAAVALAADGFIQVHFPQFAGRRRMRVEADRADDVANVVHKNVKDTASLYVSALNILEIGIGVRGVGR